MRFHDRPRVNAPMIDSLLTSVRTWARRKASEWRLPNWKKRWYTAYITGWLTYLDSHASGTPPPPRPKRRLCPCTRCLPRRARMHPRCLLYDELLNKFVLTRTFMRSQGDAQPVAHLAHEVRQRTQREGNLAFTRFCQQSTGSKHGLCA